MSNAVYQAVRCVGTIKPVFSAKENGFLPPDLIVSGTGFWVKDFSCFLTCAHVVDDFLGKSIEQSGMLVVGGNGFAYQRATVAVLDWRHDLAVLSIKDNFDSLQRQAADGLTISKTDPDVAEEIAYAGFPFGTGLLDANHTPTYSEGTVGKLVCRQTYTRSIVQITGPVVGGYSGSPVVLKGDKERLIGVLANGPSEDGNTGNIFRAIHWQHVADICQLFAR